MEIIRKYFDDFTDNQSSQFAALEALYTEWNSQINLISRKDIDQLYLKHILHSLALVPVAQFANGSRILDIGTGGGFPGIPLAILYPEIEFVLCDSIQKKLKVVTAIKEALKLDNVEVKWGRAEEIKQKNSFDFAVSRAVAPLGKLWSWTNLLIRKGGQSELDNGLLCLKGGDLHQEISESQTSPMLWEINTFFEEEVFKDKFVVYVKK